jgi:hypothetical protein
LEQEKIVTAIKRADNRVVWGFIESDFATKYFKALINANGYEYMIRLWYSIRDK